MSGGYIEAGESSRYVLKSIFVAAEGRAARRARNRNGITAIRAGDYSAVFGNGFGIRRSW
jgi:hypothetical protein